MGTNNFHNVNARKIYAIEFDENIDSDIEYENLKSDLFHAIKEEFKGFFEFGGSIIKSDDRAEDELRSYPAIQFTEIKSIKYYSDTVIYIELYAIFRSGYYEGCNLDWSAKVYVSGTHFDLDHEFTASELHRNSYDNIRTWNLLAPKVNKFIKKESEIMIDKLESVYERYSTPLIKKGSMSNGEAVYGNS